MEIYPSEERKPAQNQVDRPVWSSSGAVWEDLAAQLPLGLFIVTPPEGDVKLNPVLARRLGLGQTESLSVQEFWERIEKLSLNPLQTRLQLEEAVEQLSAENFCQVNIKSRTGENLELGFGALGAGLDPAERFMGWIRDINLEINRNQAQIKLLADLCSRTRRSAAAAQGNLAALLNNFPSWDRDVIADFLDDTKAEIELVQQSLDLALSYTGLIKGIPIYRDSVEIVSLVNDIADKQLAGKIRLSKTLAGKGNIPGVQIDPGLTKLVLETIFQELLRHNPPGQQVEARLETSADYLVLKLLSPRTLPLPGINEDQDMSGWDEAGTKLDLARELLSIQGGKLAIQNRPLQDGGGLDIEVHFPLEEYTDQAGNQPVPQRVQGERSGRILLAETQPDYQLRLREDLTDLGYRVDLAVDGSAVLDMVQTINPDLVVLARNLPGMDGLLVTQGIRRWSDVPIIMISSRLNPDDQLYAYRLGVDDYLRKPLLIEELLAKVNVFITRQHAHYQERIPEMTQTGSVRINHTLRQVWIRGELVELTPIEYNLLAYMARHGRQIIPYEQLQESVWEGPEKGSRQGLFVHVRRLREKIELDPQQPKIIRNKWGVGYVFNP